MNDTTETQERVALDVDDIAQPTDGEPLSPEDGTGELSLNVIFKVLKNERRRQVIAHLNERRERVSLSDLAEHIAAIENDTTPRRLTSQQRKRVYIALYQCHLPKLDSMEIIDFNPDRGHAELGPAAGQLNKYLDIDEDESRPWPYYYAGVGVLSALMFWSGAVTNVVDAVGAAVLFGMICVVGLALTIYYAHE